MVVDTNNHYLHIFMLRVVYNTTTTWDYVAEGPYITD
jgi:hypothetical protein